MTRILQYLSIFIIFSLASCGPELRPFTTKLLNDGGWRDNDLKKIQFYNSNDIVIRRKITDGTSEISPSGTIKMVKGVKVEEVRIKHGTPGVFLFRVKDDKFAVSFDGNSDKRYLMFGPNPKRQGEYVLLASEWQDRQGKVRYDDKFYFTDGESALAGLLVDLKKFRKIEVSSNTARGRKVN